MSPASPPIGAVSAEYGVVDKFAGAFGAYRDAVDAALGDARTLLQSLDALEEWLAGAHLAQAITRLEAVQAHLAAPGAIEGGEASASER